MTDALGSPTDPWPAGPRPTSGLGKLRLAIIAPHPVQYHAPLYRSICRTGQFDAKVLYLDKLGLEGAYDRDFRVRIAWDTPLLDGYDHKFLKNYALNRLSGFGARINPGIYPALQQGRYQVVLIQGYASLSCWIALFSARRLGIRVVWRGEATERGVPTDPPAVRRAKDFLIGSFLRRCDAILYSCAGNLDFLRRYRIPERAFFFFPCAVDNDYFRSEFERLRPSIPKIRRELGIGEGDLVVLYCGRLTRRKRVMDALQALKSSGGRETTFVIMGDGPLREEALAFGREHGISVRHLGFVNQSKVSRYYAIADVFLLLSEYDPSPKALNEAMNFDLVPIVSERIGTCRNLVLDGETGFVVPPGEIKKIAEKIETLRADRRLRHRLARSARKRVALFSFAADTRALELACRYSLAKTGKRGQAIK